LWLRDLYVESENFYSLIF